MKGLLGYVSNPHCTEKGMAALLWADFDCETLANKYYYDYGDTGVIH